MQYLFQGWNCRMPGKYKDLIMDVATEEIGHVEMIATMIAGCWKAPRPPLPPRLPRRTRWSARCSAAWTPSRRSCRGRLTAGRQQRYPWNGRYIVADFRANVAAEAQGRLQTALLYEMTDDLGVKNMPRFNLARSPTKWRWHRYRA